MAEWMREKNPQWDEEVIHSPEAVGGLAQCFSGHAREGGPAGTWSPGQVSGASAGIGGNGENQVSFIWRREINMEKEKTRMNPEVSDWSRRCWCKLTIFSVRKEMQKQTRSCVHMCCLALSLTGIWKQPLLGSRGHVWCPKLGL